MIVDGCGEIVLVNAQTERLFGYRREELLGERMEILVPDRFRERHPGHREDYSADPRPRSTGAGRCLFGQRKDGSEFPVEISLGQPETEDGTLVSSAVRDMTDRRPTERDAQHFRAVVESSRDAIIGKDLDGQVVSWNPGAERLYGYAESEIVGRSISVLIPPGHDDELTDILGKVRSGVLVDGYETVRVCKDGTQVDVSLTVSPIRDQAGDIVGAATIARDISVELRYRDQLRLLAENDALTGLHNRRRFERDLSDQIGRARRYGEHAALLIMDVDKFKQINDTHGHKTGDRALKEIAAALKQRLRDTDTISRIGGDEFAVLLPYAEANQAETMTNDLRRVIGERTIETLATAKPTPLSVSIGAALIIPETESAEAVFAEADRAMYRDKKSKGQPTAP